MLDLPVTSFMKICEPNVLKIGVPSLNIDDHKAAPLFYTPLWCIITTWPGNMNYR